MPWKNGQGLTAQIDLCLDPPSSSKNFAWKLSAATVKSESSFSRFPKMQRILVVWKGQGLWLNENLLNPFEPITFSGEKEIQCRLLQGEVLDLGLIYNPLKVDASLKIYSLVDQQSLLKLNFEEGTHYVIAAEADVIAHDILVKNGDTLKVVGALNMSVRSVLPAKARIFVVSVINRD